MRISDWSSDVCSSDLLPRLDRFDEGGGFEQGLVGAGIEPGEAATQRLQLQRVGIEIAAIEIGDFQLATRRWLEACRVIAHLAVVEIQAGEIGRASCRESVCQYV